MKCERNRMERKKMGLVLMEDGGSWWWWLVRMVNEDGENERRRVTA